MNNAPSIVVVIFVLVTICARSLSCAGELAELTPAQRTAIAELPRVPPGLNGDLRMSRHPGDRVRCSLSVTVTAPQLVPETWLIAVPKPPTLPSQRLLHISTAPTSAETTDQSVLGRTILRNRIDVNRERRESSVAIDYKFDLQLFRRVLTDDATAKKGSWPTLPEEQRASFLRPTLETDYMTETFRVWKKKNKLTRQPREGEVQFARRVFQRIVREFDYRYLPTQQRTASLLCQSEATDCGGLSILFTTVMRSEGIPARLLIGRWAKSAKATDTVDGHRYFQSHVIAEFFAHGVGWVPVDPASAILHDSSKERLRFFGRDGGNFVTLHVDPGLRVDTLLFGIARVNFCQRPVYWVRGTGRLDGHQMSEDWTVTPLPASPKDVSP